VNRATPVQTYHNLLIFNTSKKRKSARVRGGTREYPGVLLLEAFRFWVSSFGFGFRFRVSSLRFRASGFGFGSGVSGFGFRVPGIPFRVQGSKFNGQASGVREFGVDGFRRAFHGCISSFQQQILGASTLAWWGRSVASCKTMISRSHPD